DTIVVKTNFKLSASAVRSVTSLKKHCRQDLDGGVYRQAVVPKRHTLLQMLLVKTAHNKAHPGVTGTYKQVVSSYHWPGVRRSISRIVKSCGICIKNKHRATLKQAAGIKKVDGIPWRSIGLDHTGPYEENGDRAKFLLVATDLLTGAIDAEVVGTTNSMNLITAARRIFARTGQPNTVHSDRGSSYVSAAFRAFLIKRNIRQRFAPPSSPRYGGKWERSHGPLNHHIRILRSRARGPYVVLEATGHTFRLRERSTGKELLQPLHNLIPTQ
ncbi:retrovirus polyprotein, putative, partial [Perkinsus marinus ATCC 50983]